MTHEELEEAVPLYAAGALERSERQALEAHLLSGCVSCHTALKEFQSVAAILPFGLSPSQPPRALKAKIMAARAPAAIAEDAPEKIEPKPSLEPGEWMNHLFPPESAAPTWSFGWAGGVAAVAILAIGGYFAWASSAKNATGTAAVQPLQAASEDQTKKVTALQQQLDERDREIARVKDELHQRTTDSTDLKDQLLQREAELEDLKFQFTARGSVPASREPEDEFAALLRVPNAKTVSLNGSDMAKQASGMLVYDARTKKAWLYAMNLPECPNGTTYQLLAIDDKPVSVGTFHMDSGDTAHLLVSRVPEFSKTKKFAVSLEPSGGRPAPTGPIYLASQS
ncbi:MAG: anti-sigma factor [Nitrospira sp.]|nr:anti-sigma factor [Nitrospira sp.]